MPTTWLTTPPPQGIGTRSRGNHGTWLPACGGGECVPWKGLTVLKVKTGGGWGSHRGATVGGPTTYRRSPFLSEKDAVVNGHSASLALRFASPQAACPKKNMFGSLNLQRALPATGQGPLPTREIS